MSSEDYLAFIVSIIVLILIFVFLLDYQVKAAELYCNETNHTGYKEMNILTPVTIDCSVIEVNKIDLLRQALVP